MRKKLVIVTLAFGAFVLATNNVQAQDLTATTNVNISLSDVISIEALGGDVTFTYANEAAYSADQNHTIQGNLRVTSTKVFGIKVKAEHLNLVGPTQTIPLDVLIIEPKVNATKPMDGLQPAFTLSTIENALITGAALGSKLLLDINYFISSDKSSSPDILGKPAEPYTQNVVYTATIN